MSKQQAYLIWCPELGSTSDDGSSVTGYDAEDAAAATEREALFCDEEAAERVEELRELGLQLGDAHAEIRAQAKEIKDLKEQVQVAIDSYRLLMTRTAPSQLPPQ